MAGGRPQAATEARRESVVAVRLTASERAALDAKASAAGLPLPDFMRAALVDAAPPRRRKAASAQAMMTAAELRELNAVGVNLNQLMKRVNAGDERDIAAPLAGVVSQLGAIFERYLK